MRRAIVVVEAQIESGDQLDSLEVLYRTSEQVSWQRLQEFHVCLPTKIPLGDICRYI